MIRQVIPGGSYAECFPDGSYYCLVGNDVVRTNGEVLTNPFVDRNDLGHIVFADYPLHLRAHPSGKFAGQGHDSGRVISYTPRNALDGAITGQWSADGPTCGVNSVCFAPDGTLHVNDHCQHGTQGIRWIEADGTIVTGDQTYDGRGTTGVAEWTRHGDIVMGQSYVDGYVVRRDGDVPRQLEPGHCTFGRYNRSGDRIAVALWKQLENCAVLFWFTIWEIAGLPLEPTAPIDPIDPDPDPDPGGPVEMPATAWALVKRMFNEKRFDYEPTEAGARAWTKAVAEQLAFSDPGAGWGRKSTSPTGEFGKDVVARHRPGAPGLIEGWELLTASGSQGPRQLTDPPTYQSLDGQFFRPVDPHDWLGGDPVDPDPDPDPGVVSQAVKDYIAAVVMASESRQTTALAQQVGIFSGEVSRLDQRISDLPPPSSGTAFDPSAYKVLTSVRFLGTYEGRIEKK